MHNACVIPPVYSITIVNVFIFHHTVKIETLNLLYPVRICGRNAAVCFIDSSIDTQVPSLRHVCYFTIK